MSGQQTMADEDVLARICRDTRAETAARRQHTSIEAMRARAIAAGAPRGFGAALMQAAAGDGYGLIAEIKKASPSSGLIRPEFDPASLARAYAEAGATCLSVLTETAHFQGSTADLRTARAAVGLPILRKDFILDAWQVYESRAIGADCILLIMAALTDDQAIELESVARMLDLDVLVEVHDRRELDRALGLQTKLIGINNRNLKTLHTDLSLTAELGQHVPPDRFLIAESGIRNHADIKALSDISVRSFLVGESLLRQRDVAHATRLLLGGA